MLMFSFFFQVSSTLAFPQVGRGRSTCQFEFTNFRRRSSWSSTISGCVQAEEEGGGDWDGVLLLLRNEMIERFDRPFKKAILGIVLLCFLGFLSGKYKIFLGRDMKTFGEWETGGQCFKHSLPSIVCWLGCWAGLACFTYDTDCNPAS